MRNFMPEQPQASVKPEVSPGSYQWAGVGAWCLQLPLDDALGRRVSCLCLPFRGRKRHDF